MQKDFNKQKLIQRAKSGVQKILQMMNKEGWKKIDDKPCQMYTMDVQGKLATKGVAELKYSVQQVYNFLQKDGTFKKLNDNCKQFKTMKKVPIEGSQFFMDINYLKYAGQWPVVSDREFIAVTYTQKNLKGDYIFPAIDANDIYQVPPQKGLVRAQIIIAGYVIQKNNENSCKVTYISCSDLKGSIPQVLINLVTKKQGSVVGILRDVMAKEIK